LSQGSVVSQLGEGGGVKIIITAAFTKFLQLVGKLGSISLANLFFSETCLINFLMHIFCYLRKKISDKLAIIFRSFIYNYTLHCKITISCKIIQVLIKSNHDVNFDI